jgi:hypothetical protein
MWLSTAHSASLPKPQRGRKYLKNAYGYFMPRKKPEKETSQT